MTQREPLAARLKRAAGVQRWPTFLLRGAAAVEARLFPQRPRLVAVPRGQLRFRPPELLPGAIAVAEGQPPLPLAAIGRLLDAYRASVAVTEEASGSFWRAIRAERQADLHQVFMTGSAEQARAILSTPLQSDLFYGFDGLCRSVQRTTDTRHHRGVGREVVDRILRLAEATGARPLFNPEIAKRQPATDLAALLQDLAARLDAELAFPNPYPGEIGLATRQGLASVRAVEAIYQAVRLRQLCNGIAAPRVAEIGGGLGRTALFAVRFGLSDYTLVDIPMTSISQGYFLMSVLGTDAVRLFGEAPGAKLHLVPPKTFLNDAVRFDVVANVDSLTEIGRGMAEAYIAVIAARDDCLWSINHEANAFTVRELLRRAPDGERDCRHPYWMRKGYVEETIRLAAWRDVARHAAT